MTKAPVHALTATALFILVSGAYLVMALQYPVAYIWSTYEDLFGEWTQTYLFAAACMVAFLIAARCKSRYRWFFAVLGLALFYTVMEEISWGQRIFGFDSPEFFRRNNLQRETNLHNLFVGPYSTTLKDAIEIGLAAALATFGGLYPLLLRFGFAPARWADAVGIAAPPLYLAPYFLVAAWLETTPFRFNEAEIAEILVGFALLIMTLHYWLALRRGIEPDPSTAVSGTESRAITVWVCTSVLVVLLAAVATTYAFYTSPEKGARIERRLLNGYEKFAKRYKRHDSWDKVIDLYLLVHEQEPNRTSVMRRLARAYREAGDDEKFSFYANSALNALLEVQESNPNKISNNLYLSITYELLGKQAEADEFAQRAHTLALGRSAAQPESAHTAYWLGKTYRHLGDYGSALDQFKKAFERNPGSKKYRDAYYDMIKATGGRP